MGPRWPADFLKMDELNSSVRKLKNLITRKRTKKTIKLIFVISVNMLVLQEDFAILTTEF